MIKQNTSSKIYPAIIFARVSSREQERGESISAQIKSCEDYCEKNNIPVLKTYPITESSTKKERKKFKEVLQFIKSYKDKVIIVANTIDRIQRHFREYFELDDLRTDNKIELHFIRKHLKITNKSNSFEIGSWIQGVAWGNNMSCNQAIISNVPMINAGTRVGGCIKLHSGIKIIQMRQD